MPAEPIIRLEHVEKTYEDVPVLRGVDFEVQRGDYVSIVGPSGCGKTTLLNIIGGLDRQFRGRALVGGHDLAGISDAGLARLRRDRLGFVFQAFHLLEHLTCRENVALPWFFADGARGRSEALARADEVLARVGLGERAGDPPTRLSGGQKQRVAIARALYHRPEIILSDEATGSLDAATAQQITDLFVSLNREDGITFVVVTHRERIARACGPVVRLEEGRLVTNGGAAA
ncbi:MAG TPA: ABC transporter ATP-binding protein [Polyangia bacterium]|jgi:ABC-type lipoprotein export system ATPase subunit